MACMHVTMFHCPCIAVVVNKNKQLVKGAIVLFIKEN